ncbi:hypothetical protein BGS_1269 [Beggiatoa sp. SS]|nr:hypothetical protein BGS_1269 [Beggiatoa sp. SS]
MGATVGWLIAGIAKAEIVFFVTGDPRGDFKNIMKTTLEHLEAAVEQLLQESDKSEYNVTKDKLFFSYQLSVISFRQKFLFASTFA